jgi:hypothetical protein
MSENKKHLSNLIWFTDIFEKEIVILIYYTLFVFIAFNETAISFQFLFFGIGTFIQIYFKAKNKMRFWNNFISSLFFLIGSAFSYKENFFFIGFFAFIFLIAVLSFIYEKWRKDIKNNLLSVSFDFLYSAIVLASFPILYFVFMKNKLNIDLREFFQDQNHLIVFSGYFVFYFLLLLNKQLMALQATMLKNKKQ